MRRLQIAAAAVLALAPAPAKTVEITAAPQVTEVACKVRFTTTIVLPRRERILDRVAGDTATWQVSGDANVTYVKPSVEGSETNVTLVTASGRIYSFLVREVSAAGTMPDLQVWARPPPAPPAAAAGGLGHGIAAGPRVMGAAVAGVVALAARATGVAGVARALSPRPLAPGNFAPRNEAAALAGCDGGPDCPYNPNNEGGCDWLSFC
ncbi:MAG: TrbG/VirB9 family P-type conjugative transfer protein [bacterium]|nr:TrbG/VirB9 family P-type conjugative transfer protein [bacterium]